MNQDNSDALRFLSVNKRYRSIGVKIQRFYTDVNGTIINKSAAPAALQTNFPFYVFGDFDAQGGYRIANTETPLLPNYDFIRTFVYGINYEFTKFSGLNDIDTKMQRGDRVFLYADDGTNPNYFVWIILSIPNRAYNSVVGNMRNPKCLERFSVYTDNNIQFAENIAISTSDDYGIYKADFLSPYSQKSAYQEDNDKITIPYTRVVDDKFVMSSYYLFDTTELVFELDFIINDDTRISR